MPYSPAVFENKWKEFWSKNATYRASQNTSKPKFYILDMFPYPSGAGLHVGHPLGYIASDIYSRYKRMSGYNVLHPMGFDAFGLPAEQYAIQTGVHPAESTDKNIEKYKSQLSNIGFDYDWDRSFKTSDPEYYKWTQWIFIQLFDHYYDTSLNKAQPISKLIQAFERDGNQGVTAASSAEEIFSAKDWNQYSDKKKSDILMNYRLAYQKESFVNWCEELGTVLANDEVKDGVSERGGYPVERRSMMQWSLRITAYAERLLTGLDRLDWSDALKAMQRNWIGKSQGAQLFFPIEGHVHSIEVFTTRPDTIFGATYMVLAPEHVLVEQITTEGQKQTISDYIEYVNTRSERDRVSDVKQVTGAFTGAYAVNPFSGEKIPIWIGEYVLADYGTGAIMAVPSDDDRDHSFATKFGLQIIPVIDKTDFPNAARQDKVGKMINSGFLNGKAVPDAIALIIDEIEKRKIGTRKINYRLRDANFSRQRYWGEPFPIRFNKEGIAETLALDELPLNLPDLENFKPASGGKSPLARLDNWVNTDKGIRETDTMPGFAGSSWYFLRYMDANNDEAFASADALSYWQDVDLYIGGTEHAVGHLMYSRFWHKFLYDLGKVPTQEPFKKLVNQGMIQGVIESIMMQKDKKDGFTRFVCSKIAESDPNNEYTKIPIHIDYVKDYGTDHSFVNTASIKSFLDWRPEYKDAIFECGNGIFHKGIFTPSGDHDDSRLYTFSEVGKMSKSKYNVVNPDEIVDRYGADCFRMYEMFLGPIEQSKPWDTKGIDGVHKFLKRFWNMCFSEEGQLILNEGEATKDELKLLHSTIKKVTEDIEKLSFNTAVSAFMVCINELKKVDCHKQQIFIPLIKLIAPFAPFMAEEIWSKLQQEGSIHVTDYPIFDESHLKSATVDYPICVNGKRRANLAVPSEATKDEIETQARNMPQIDKWLEGKEIKRVIVVPGRMVNFVI